MKMCEEIYLLLFLMVGLQSANAYKRRLEVNIITLAYNYNQITKARVQLDRFWGEMTAPIMVWSIGSKWLLVESTASGFEIFVGLGLDFISVTHKDLVQLLESITTKATTVPTVFHFAGITTPCLPFTVVNVIPDRTSEKRLHSVLQLVQFFSNVNAK